MSYDLCTDEYILRRVVELRVSIAGEPVALFEDLIDLVNVALAVTRRSPGAQGTPALRPALLFGLGLPACEPHGMALDVLQCIHDGQETTDQVLGIDGAVIDGFSSTTGAGGGGRRLRLAEEAEHWMPRIGGLIEGVDAGLGSTAHLFLKRRPKRLSGSNRLNNGRRLRFCLGSPVLLRGTLGPVDAARLGFGSTTMSRAAARMSRLTADSAVRNLPSTKR